MPNNIVDCKSFLSSMYMRVYSNQRAYYKHPLKYLYIIIFDTEYNIM